ncbi:MAG: hypothetical protein ACLP5H_20565, partial [Desulfomonilaceae bacterium]
LSERLITYLTNVSIPMNVQELKSFLSHNKRPNEFRYQRNFGKGRPEQIEVHPIKNAILRIDCLIGPAYGGE